MAGQLLSEELERQLHEIAMASLQQRIVYDPGEISADDLGAGALGPNKVWHVPSSPWSNRPCPVPMQAPDPAPTPDKITATQEQVYIKERFREQDVFMTLEEEQTLQARCAIHGHVWEYHHRPSASDPLGQRTLPPESGDACMICGARMP